MLTGASDKSDLAGQEVALVRSEGTWVSVHLERVVWVWRLKRIVRIMDLNQGDRM